jgi:hypothetical protein
MTGDEPTYEPQRYNGNPEIQDTHNCWSYGLNVIDKNQLGQCKGKGKSCEPMYHQPGATKGLTERLYDVAGRRCDVVEDLMVADIPSIKKTTFHGKCPVGTSKIALAMHRGEDYHFWRQDSNGWWSHKDGANPVKTFDAEGMPIWNPKTAARDYRSRGSFLNYKDFCGFYCVPRHEELHISRGGFRKASRTRRKRRHLCRSSRSRKTIRMV